MKNPDGSTSNPTCVPKKIKLLVGVKCDVRMQLLLPPYCVMAAVLLPQPSVERWWRLVTMVVAAAAVAHGRQCVHSMIKRACFEISGLFPILQRLNTGGSLPKSGTILGF